jgi:hypothetical protein
MSGNPQLISVNGAVKGPSATTDDLAWAEAVTLRLADSPPDVDEPSDQAPF